MEWQIQANAELVRNVARDDLGVTINYDEAGVRWLDQYIDHQREATADDVKDRLPNTLGAFLGECIRQTYGGSWTNDPDLGWAVKVTDRLTVAPFSKVQKQLASADGESVLGFFQTIDALRHAPVRPTQPWWRFW